MRGIRWLLIVAVVLIAGLLLTGCGGKKTEPTPQSQPKAEQQALEPAKEQPAPKPVVKEEPATEEKTAQNAATEKPAKENPAQEPGKEELAPAGPPKQPADHKTLGDNCVGCHSATLPANHAKDNCAGCHQPSS